jgi:hypothetical protein
VTAKDMRRRKRTGGGRKEDDEDEEESQGEEEEKPNKAGVAGDNDDDDDDDDDSSVGKKWSAEEWKKNRAAIDEWVGNKVWVEMDYKHDGAKVRVSVLSGTCVGYGSIEPSVTSKVPPCVQHIHIANKIKTHRTHIQTRTHSRAMHTPHTHTHSTHSTHTHTQRNDLNNYVVLTNVSTVKAVSHSN